MRTMRTVLVTAILVVAIISSGSLASSPVAAAAPQNLRLREWPVPHGSAELGGIIADSSGRIWFTENSSGWLGLLDPVVNKIYEWGAWSANSRNIVTGRAGAFGGTSNRIYFAEYSRNEIAFLDNVTGYLNYLTEFGINGTDPVSVAVDNTGDIWFTVSGNPGYIGELSGINTAISSTTAQLSEWALPAFSSALGFGNGANLPCNCLPWGIYVNQTSATSSSSPDTYVWFTEKIGGTNGHGAIGRLQVSTNTLTMWDLGVSPLSGIHGPTDITVDSSGNVYWTNSASAGNSLSLLGNGQNTYKEYALATTSAAPVSPFPDPARKAVWALEYTGNNILYLDTTAITTTGLTPAAAQCTISPATNARVANCPNVATQTTASVARAGQRSLGYPNTVTPVNPTSSGSLGSPSGPFNGLYEYGLLSASAGPYSLFLDANENLWITESSSTVNRIAEIQFPADFSLQLTSSSSQSVPQGGSETYSISITPTTDQQVPVTLSVNALSGLTPSFSTPIGTPPFTSTLTISTTSSTTPTTYAMSITGKSSSATHSLSITLTVTSTLTQSVTVTLTTTQYSVSQTQSGVSPTTFIQVSSNSTVSNFQFDSSKLLLNFTVSGPSGTIGYTNVVIAKNLLNGSPAVLIDNGLTPVLALSLTSNSTHYFIAFTYHHSTHQITIGGSNTVPEFQTSALPLLAGALLMISLAVQKRRKR
jgi:streptogramin lyase